MKLRPNNFKESPGQYARGEFSRRHFSVLHKLTVHLCRGLGDIGLVLIIDHPRGPVLGHEGANVGSWVADAGLRVAQEVILDIIK